MAAHCANLAGRNAERRRGTSRNGDVYLSDTGKRPAAPFALKFLSNQRETRYRNPEFVPCGARTDSSAAIRKDDIMATVKDLQKHGQAVWLDFLARGFIAKGDLKKLVDEGVRGVTSNPSIFEKAIGGSAEYDDQLTALIKQGDRPVGELYEALAVQDIKSAADVLRPVYDALKGADGFVSLEVSPYLALDTQGTIAEARKLWRDVDRKNLMIKVPGTREGLPAIRALISEGINVNITLLFAQQVYADVLEAYLSGLEAYVAKGGDPAHVASVASFFVSRIDTAADKQLDDKIAAANDGDQKARLAALQGKVAIANAKLAYQHYKQVTASARWKKLADKGARVQRLLWASTGTKNKAYSDVLYVEELIGPTPSTQCRPQRSTHSAITASCA